MAKFWGIIRRRLEGKPRRTTVKNTVEKDPESSVSKTSIPRLERLSDDLLLDIMELVAIPQTAHPMQECLGTIDLLSLMCCNRHMYVLGEPILYRNLIESSPLRLPKFIRTIIGRPHLAEYVRNVKFKDRITLNTPALLEVLSSLDKGRIEFLIESRIIPDNTDPDKFEQGKLIKAQPTETPSYITTFRSRPDMKRDEDRKNFKTGLQAGYWTFMRGFILSLLPNIEELHISISRDSSHPDGLTQVLLRAAEFRYRSTTSPSPKPLSRLRDLTLSYDNYQRCPGIWYIFPYLAHHTLQSFTGDLIRSRYFEITEYWSLLPPELRLKSLRLKRSNIHTQSLHKLLQYCPVLEILEYEHEHFPGDLIFNPEKFVSSIEHLKPCLQELGLVLCGRGRYYPNTADISEEVTTISLSEFEKLTNLSITANLWLGALKSPKASRDSTIYQATYQWQPPPPEQKFTQCLPRSLEYLCLKECSGWVEEEVSELVEQAAIVTPNLKTLVLKGTEFESPLYYANLLRRPAAEPLFRRNQSAARKLEEDCIAKGIKLDVRYY
jgi:hypothetical protein